MSKLCRTVGFIYQQLVVSILNDKKEYLASAVFRHQMFRDKQTAEQIQFCNRKPAASCRRERGECVMNNPQNVCLPFQGSNVVVHKKVWKWEMKRPERGQ